MNLVLPLSIDMIDSIDQYILCIRHAISITT